MMMLRLLALSLLGSILGCGSLGSSPQHAPPVSDQQAVRVPFERVGNFVYLRAGINGSEPLWFLLDTGATASYLDAERAAAVGLGQSGSVEDATLRFPGLQVANQRLLVRPLRFGSYNGLAVDGLLGFDFIARFVIGIDYENNTVSFEEPSGYEYRGSGEVIPLTMLEDDSGGKVPLARVAIARDGHPAVEGNFIMDTAVRISISFNTPFVDANNLLTFAPRTIQAPLGGGAMVREADRTAGRVPTVRLGRFTFENPVAIFFRDSVGVFTSPEFDGVVGAEVLRRFDVVIDYTHSRMILEPNRHLHEPEEYDMSGTLLVAEGPDLSVFRVRRVMEGSPATAAGLREGDVILAIDGESTSGLRLEQVRLLFKQEGRSYRLTVERDGREVRVELNLSKLI